MRGLTALPWAPNAPALSQALLPEGHRASQGCCPTELPPLPWMWLQVALLGAAHVSGPHPLPTPSTMEMGGAGAALWDGGRSPRLLGAPASLGQFGVPSSSWAQLPAGPQLIPVSCMGAVSLLPSICPTQHRGRLRGRVGTGQAVPSCSLCSLWLRGSRGLCHCACMAWGTVREGFSRPALQREGSGTGSGQRGPARSGCTEASLRPCVPLAGSPTLSLPGAELWDGAGLGAHCLPQQLQPQIPAPQPHSPAAPQPCSPAGIGAAHLTPCPSVLSPPFSLPFQKVMLPTGAAFRWFQ